MTIWSDIEELDYQETTLGELLLRRRRDPAIPGEEIFEVKLGDDFLMSSQFHASEVALADLGLAALSADRSGPWAVVVGGLGLGHTAHAALAHPRVGEVIVIEFLAPIIGWHQAGLVPLGRTLAGDTRCKMVQADFFAAASGDEGFDPDEPQRQFDAILLDIDHAPDNWLGEASESFYTAASLRSMSEHLAPGGVFALWSNDPPSVSFETELHAAFTDGQSHIVEFPNPYTGTQSACTVYIGVKED